MTFHLEIRWQVSLKNKDVLLNNLNKSPIAQKNLTSMHYYFLIHPCSSCHTYSQNALGSWIFKNPVSNERSDIVFMICNLDAMYIPVSD